MTTTWSQTAKNVHAALSNGDLTAASDGTAFQNLLGRSVDASALTAGSKKYWEIRMDAGNAAGTIGIGVASNAFLTDAFMGQTANGIAYQPAGGVEYNGAPAATLAPFTIADVIGVAADYSAAKIWFRKNGGNWNNDILSNQNPATGTGGIDISLMVAGPVSIFPAYELQTQEANDQQTANFGATALAFAAPSGFTSFDGVPVAPVANVGGGFHHIGRVTRDELEPEEESVTEATTEALPVKPPSRKMRKRLAAAKKQPAPPPVDDEEEEAMMIGLAA